MCTNQFRIESPLIKQTIGLLIRIFPCYFNFSGKIYVILDFCEPKFQSIQCSDQNSLHLKMQGIYYQLVGLSRDNYDFFASSLSSSRYISFKSFKNRFLSSLSCSESTSGSLSSNCFLDNNKSF